MSTSSAGTPLTRKSEASTPSTGSLNKTSTAVNACTVVPAGGYWFTTVGGAAAVDDISTAKAKNNRIRQRIKPFLLGVASSSVNVDSLSHQRSSVTSNV